MLNSILQSLFTPAVSKHRPAEPGITLGVLANQPKVRVPVSDAEALRHFLISGTPGTGATRLIEDILGQRTEQGLGWVYLDPDQDYELRDKLYSKAVAAKREDEFFVVDFLSPATSYSFDILEGAPADVASELIEVLASSDSSPGVDFYRQSCRAAIELMLEAFQASGRKYTLEDLIAVLMDKNATEALIHLLPEDSDIAQRLADFNRTHMADEIKRYRQLLPVASRLVQLNTFDRKNVLNTAMAQVSLKDILCKNQLCVIILPAGDELSMVGRVLLAKLKHALQSRAELPARLRKQVTTVCLPRSNAYLAPASATTLFSHARAYGVSLLATWVAKAAEEVAPSQLEGNTWTKLDFEPSGESKDAPYRVVIGDKKFICKPDSGLQGPCLQWRPKELAVPVDYRFPLNLHFIPTDARK